MSISRIARRIGELVEPLMNSGDALAAETLCGAVLRILSERAGECRRSEGAIDTLKRLAAESAAWRRSKGLHVATPSDHDCITTGDGGCEGPHCQLHAVFP